MGNLLVATHPRNQLTLDIRKSFDTAPGGKQQFIAKDFLQQKQQEKLSS